MDALFMDDVLICSNRLQEFKKRFWEMKLAEATEKVKVINERLVSAKTKREGESTPAGAAGAEAEETPAGAAGAAAGGEGAAGAAVCLENGDGGAEHPEEALPSGKNPAAEAGTGAQRVERKAGEQSRKTPEKM
jgi:hypothetical protein